ncbi:MAG: retropepsin-like aspartic protease [Planctomycetaceae bacterium]
MAHVTDTTIMGRIRIELDVDGRKCWTLFDSGARNSYISRSAAEGLNLLDLSDPTSTRLGGGIHEIREACLIQTRLDGHPLHFQAGVIDEIGRDEAGREIDILFGAIAMQLWGIQLDLQNETLDLSHFTTEFLEF